MKNTFGPRNAVINTIHWLNGDILKGNSSKYIYLHIFGAIIMYTWHRYMDYTNCICRMVSICLLCAFDVEEGGDGQVKVKTGSTRIVF